MRVVNKLVDALAAHRALGLPEQPAIDARQMEHVAARRQLPRALAGLELLAGEQETQTPLSCQGIHRTAHQLIEEA